MTQLLTKACDVENPTPPRLTPVTKMVLLQIPSGKALATSRPSVSLLKSGCDVVIIREDWEIRESKRQESELRNRQLYKLCSLSEE